MGHTRTIAPTRVQAASRRRVDSAIPGVEPLVGVRPQEIALAMKIAILGTRGIPNNYGGPETNAECLAPRFVAMGHEVTVYSPDEHPFRGVDWHGVRIRHMFCRESRLRIWGTLLYDFLCLRDAVAQDFDVLLELGNVPCALFYPLFWRRRGRLVTNMDGLEWRRTKWSPLLRRFARLTERMGARYSDALIADNLAMADYLRETYDVASDFIPYGAELVESPPTLPLSTYDVEAGRYFLLIARMEPENNIEMILDGFLASGSDHVFLVVGPTTTRHGQQVRQKYAGSPRIRLLEGIFERKRLDILRWHSALYFHGHSVGGTNPSLVEAMAASAHIAVHDNAFNRAVVGDDALRFASVADVTRLIDNLDSTARAGVVARNREKVATTYDWQRIAEQHLALFARLLAGGRGRD